MFGLAAAGLFGFGQLIDWFKKLFVRFWDDWN